MRLELRFQKLILESEYKPGTESESRKRSGLLANLAKWEFGTEFIWFRKIKKYDLFNTLNIEQVVPFRHIFKMSSNSLGPLKKFYFLSQVHK